MGSSLLNRLVELLEKDFPNYLIKPPTKEEDLHNLVYMYLVLSGFKVNYTGGRSAPDLVVTTSRSKTEIPIEVKLASTSTAVTSGLKQLFEYMKGTKWKEGILLILDTSKKKVAKSKAEEIGKVTKYGRTIKCIALGLT